MDRDFNKLLATLKKKDEEIRVLNKKLQSTKKKFIHLGVIGQIITWEQKSEFFPGTTFGEEPTDLLVVGELPNPNVLRRVLGLFKVLRSEHKYENLIFKKGGLNVFVDRPHSYKVGDLVEIKQEVIKR